VSTQHDLDHWNPNIGKPTIWDFIERFSARFSSEKGYWPQVVDRLCDLCKLHGAILMHERGGEDAQVVYRHSPPQESSDDNVANTVVDFMPAPDLPSPVSWSVFKELLDNAVYYEVIEELVPAPLRLWGVANFMIFALPAREPREEIVLLVNAPATHLFDTQAWRLCRTILDLLNNHWIAVTKAPSAKGATERSPLVQLERQRIELEVDHLWTGSYDLAKVGRFLELAVDHWPRRDLGNLLEDVLPDFLGMVRTGEPSVAPQNARWRMEAEEVVRLVESWPRNVRANVARAFLALGNVELAEKILSIKSQGQGP
jgi:hypothetical protein